VPCAQDGAAAGVCRSKRPGEVLEVYWAEVVWDKTVALLVGPTKGLARDSVMGDASRCHGFQRMWSPMQDQGKHIQQHTC
jgi:hypothetical protein